MPAPTNPQASKLAAQFKKASMPVTRRRTVKGGDPNKHYRFVHKNNVDARREDYGYEIVRHEGAVVTNKESLEGAIMSGGDVLMCCPREEWEAREKYRQEEAKRFQEGPRESFKTLGAAQGVQTFDKTRSRYGTMQDELGQAPD